MKIGWMMFEVQEEGKLEQMTKLKCLERKGGVVNFACLRNNLKFLDVRGFFGFKF